MSLFETINYTTEDLVNVLGTGANAAKRDIADYFNEDTTMTRKALCIALGLAVLAGTVYGFMLAPVKKGISINVNNGPLPLSKREQKKLEKELEKQFLKDIENDTLAFDELPFDEFDIEDLDNACKKNKRSFFKKKCRCKCK